MVFFKQKTKLAFLQFQKKLGIWSQHFLLVSGAPRSGTTALCQWLNRQRGVASFGESRMLIATHRFLEEVHRFRRLEKRKKDLVDMARRLTYVYYLDHRVLLGRSLILCKEPLEPIAFPDKQYKAFLENVRIVLPEAKFIFMIRDPVATVWSMKQKKWGSSLTNFEPRTFSVEEHTESWCSCVDCILQYTADPNTYICQFGRLITDPENESKQILDFLKIRKGQPFQPRQTKSTGFSKEERALILRISRPQLKALYAQGISDLT